MCATKPCFLIFHEDKDFLIVIKSRGLSCAPLKQSGQESLIELIFKDFPETKNIQGRQIGEGGLLHRLDHDTQGLVLIARNQAFYDHMQEQARQGLFKKYYLAHCHLQKPTLAPEGYTTDTWAAQMQSLGQLSCTFSCSFVKAAARSARVRPIQHQSRHSSNILYTTCISLSRQQEFIRARCCLQRGFRHQVRASLCAVGLPIIGDPLYPDEEKKELPFCFWATGLSFPLCGAKNIKNFSYDPQDFVNIF